MGIESIQPPTPFQAEYEGSIPFTRSSRDFNDLAGNLKLPFWRHSDSFDTSRLNADANSRAFSDST
jgi:hypothetical protein